MSKRIKNPPNAYELMNSIRSIGYSFKTAVADIVDNSISAYATHIDIDFSTNSDNENMYVTILDDGNGMDNDELLKAMKYASTKDEYGQHDLGRFGLGLKSASLSQCRVLTVASKQNNSICAFMWDIDRVNDWECIQLDLDEIEILPNIEKLINMPKGTLVIWQNFDIGEKKYNGLIQKFLSDAMEETEKYLRIVFHRYMTNRNNKLVIHINNNALIPIDPFLENNPKTDKQKEMELEGGIKIKGYILPHQNDLTAKDIEMLGGQDELNNGQGFYIYRNNRLIQYGTWLDLTSKSISNELFKYGRIRVDIPNTMDEVWEVDITKKNVIVPKSVVNQLRNMVREIRKKSDNKSQKRQKIGYESDEKRIWNKQLNRDEKTSFYINTNAFCIREYIDSINDKDKTKVLRLLDLISKTLPLDDIYYECASNKCAKEIDDDILDSIIKIGLDLVLRFQTQTKCSIDEALEKIRIFEPFNEDTYYIQLKKEVKK